MVDESVLRSFDDLREVLHEHVPGLPSTATPAFDVSRHGMLDHFQRTALRAFVRDIRPDATEDAILAASTLGDVWSLVRGAELQTLHRTRRSGERFRTSQVTLAPLKPEDVEHLYRASLDPAWAHRWRWRGRTPSPEEFHRSLFAGVACQFTVRDRNGTLIGMVVAYDEDPNRFHCHLGVLRCAPESVGGAMVEGAVLFVSYLFTSFPYDRVFADVPEYNLPLLEGLTGTILQPEGKMADYYWHGGRRWARCFFSLRRTDWEPLESVILPPG